jgi:hypothetical protein
MELVEFQMIVGAAIWGGNGNVSAPIPYKLKGLFDGRGSRFPYKQAPEIRARGAL